jgi:hypothetical protein
LIEKSQTLEFWPHRLAAGTVAVQRHVVMAVVAG